MGIAGKHCIAFRDTVDSGLGRPDSPVDKEPVGRVRLM